MWILEHCPLGEKWEKSFPTKAKAVAELAKHICGDCLNGIDRIVDTSMPGNLREEKSGHGKPNPKSSRDLLSTACGCEYHLYRTGARPGRVKTKTLAPIYLALYRRCFRWAATMNLAETSPLFCSNASSN